MPRYESVVVLVVSVIACAGGAVYLGQDANWDQRNYHLYVVFAWLTNRISLDVAPSQIQTWLNPLSHVPAYFLITTTPPVVAGAVLGALAGVNGLLLWLITRAVVGAGNPAQSICALSAAICGLTGSLFISFLGTSFSENLCTPLVLGSLLCLIPDRRRDDLPSSTNFLAAGLCLGAACGLKLTHLIYALGLAAALLVLWPVFRLRLSSILMFAAGGVMGFVVIGGYWTVRLYADFGNPAFPFFNGLFQSPWYPPVNFSDTRFLPSSFLYATVAYPFQWLMGAHPTSEVAFREPRFALVAVLLPLSMIVAATRSRGSTSWPFWLTGLFFCSSYFVWMEQFAYQRYALALELLAGPTLVISLQRMLRDVRQVAVVSALVVACLIVLTRPADWYRVPYGRDWFGLQSIEANAAPTLYVMTGAQPTAYVIPYLSPRHRFVRIAGNMPLGPETMLGHRTQSVIAGFDGPVRTLGAAEPNGSDRRRLKPFGLSVVPDSCRSFHSTMDVFWSCELAKESVTR